MLRAARTASGSARREHGTSHGIDRAVDGGRDHAQGRPAHPADDDADRQESDPGVSAGRPRARRQVRRRAGAPVRPRALYLPATCRALQPLRPLGADARRSQRRHGLSDDAGPAGVPGSEDRALYIYASGTTGLPKAANMNHYRVMLASYAFAGVMDTRASDRMYDCLPLYHTAGGVVATGALLVKGGSVVIRDKFSVREFWDDIVRWDCTCFQYIREPCRYLVHSPPDPKERAHHLRLACGNGLRPDVWAQFKRRFQIPQIIEFYAATEGNVSLFNFDGKEGAVGRLPWWVAARFPTKIVRFDAERQQPVRDE